MCKPQHRIKGPSWLCRDSFARFSRALIPRTQQAAHVHTSPPPHSFSLSSKTLPHLFILSNKPTSESFSFGKPFLTFPELFPLPGIHSTIISIRKSFVTWVCLFVITFVSLSFFLQSPPPTMLWGPWGQSQVVIHLYPWSIALDLRHTGRFEKF